MQARRIPQLTADHSRTGSPRRSNLKSALGVVGAMIPGIKLYFCWLVTILLFKPFSQCERAIERQDYLRINMRNLLDHSYFVLWHFLSGL
jgi:hypothetical protein